MNRLVARWLWFGAVALCGAAQGAPAAVTLPKPPQRIVSLLPSLTESVCALGACSRLVGTDRFSNWPAEVVALPKLGGLEDAQVERIVALRPDVVLAAPSARVVDRLSGLGLKVVVLESNTHADVKRALQTLSELLGVPAQGASLWAGIEQQVEAATKRVPPVVRGRRVYFEIDSTPYAAGAGSFIGDTLSRLGMANIVSPQMGPFPRLNPEFVVSAQPDIVMAAQRNLVDMAGRPGWQSLRALITKQNCGFTSERYELLTRPGPRLGEAANLLADCLQALDRAR
jgi:iron complex transport system substrate-binding protein